MRTALPSVSSDALAWTWNPFFWLSCFSCPRYAACTGRSDLVAHSANFRWQPKNSPKPDLAYHFDPGDTAEFAALTDSMNTMAARAEFQTQHRDPATERVGGRTVRDDGSSNGIGHGRAHRQNKPGSGRPFKIRRENVKGKAFRRPFATPTSIGSKLARLRALIPWKAT